MAPLVCCESAPLKLAPVAYEETLPSRSRPRTRKRYVEPLATRTSRDVFVRDELTVEYEPPLMLRWSVERVIPLPPALSWPVQEIVARIEVPESVPLRSFAAGALTVGAVLSRS